MTSSAWKFGQWSELWQRMIENVIELLDLSGTAQLVAALSQCRLSLAPSWGQFCVLAKDPCSVQALRPPLEKMDELVLALVRTSEAHSSAYNIGYDHLQLLVQTFVGKKDIECLKTSWLLWRHHCDQFTSSSASLRLIPFSLRSRRERSGLEAHVCSL